MFTFNIYLAVLLSVSLLLSEKKLQVEADECSSNLGCSGYNNYCCKRRSWQNSVCRSGGCVGQSCSSSSDCGGLFEKCCSSTNLCATSSCPGCSSSFDCGSNEYCCKRYSWQTNVCGSGGCVGKSCSSDSDCGGIGECCLNNVCKDSGCYDDVAKALASWVIGVIVVSVLVAVVIPIAIIACCCCGVASASRGPAYRGVVVTQPTNSATVVALQNTQGQTVQSNPAQFQSSPYPPPPAYPNQGENVPPAQFQTQVPPPAYKY